MSNTERQKAQKELQKKLSEAQWLLSDCVKLAEEHGIAFEQPSCGGYGTYVPKKLFDNPDLADNEDEEIYQDYPGWTTSSIC